MCERQRDSENCYFYLISHRPDLRPDNFDDTVDLAKSLAVEYEQKGNGEGLYKYLNAKFSKA